MGEEEESKEEVIDDLEDLVKVKIILNQLLEDQIQMILKIEILNPEDQNLSIQIATQDLEKVGEDKIVNSYSVKEISDLLKKYGEEKNHFKIASEIVRYRTKKKISTCEDLSEIINKINKNKSNINHSTRTFQA